MKTLELKCDFYWVNGQYFLANVVARQEDDWLQFTDQHFQEAGITAVEKLNSGNSFEMYIQGDVCHHFSG